MGLYYLITEDKKTYTKTPVPDKTNIEIVIVQKEPKSIKQEELIIKNNNTLFLILDYLFNVSKNCFLKSAFIDFTIL